MKHFVSVSSLALLAGLASAQPAKLAWSRTNLYAGVAIDTVGQAMINAAGNFVLAGADSAGPLPKGNITVINRKTAAMTHVTISPPVSGPLGIARILEDEGFYYVFGTNRPIGSPSDQIYVGKFDQGLNLLAHATFNANTYTGTESVTGVGIDANNNIYITGIAQKNNIWQVWLAKTNASVSTFSLNFGKVDVTKPTLPQLEVDGIIAVLIGLIANNGPMVRSYKPTGGLNFSWGVTWPSVATTFALDLGGISAGYLFGGASWSDEPLPGVPMSHGAMFRVNTVTGVGDALYQLPDEPGVSSVTFEDIMISSLSSRRVNGLYRRNQRTESVSLNESLGFVSKWTDSTNSSTADYIGVSPWGEVVMAIMRGSTVQNIFGIAVNNANRFSINGPFYNMILPYVEQDNLFHLPSGDMLALRSNAGQMQINCVQQSPIAVTNSYSCRTGITFRPLEPVTTNDRYAEGSAITISQMPMHGTLTMGTNGFFNYKATGGYTGPDSFKYRLTKAALTPSEATVNLAVTP